MSGDFDLNDRERSRRPSVINDTLLKEMATADPKLTTLKCQISSTVLSLQLRTTYI